MGIAVAVGAGLLATVGAGLLATAMVFHDVRKALSGSDQEPAKGGSSKSGGDLQPFALTPFDFEHPWNSLDEKEKEAMKRLVNMEAFEKKVQEARDTLNERDRIYIGVGEKKYTEETAFVAAYEAVAKAISTFEWEKKRFADWVAFLSAQNDSLAYASRPNAFGYLEGRYESAIKEVVVVLRVKAAPLGRALYYLRMKQYEDGRSAYKAGKYAEALQAYAEVASFADMKQKLSKAAGCPVEQLHRVLGYDLAEKVVTEFPLPASFSKDLQLLRGKVRPPTVNLAELLYAPKDYGSRFGETQKDAWVMLVVGYQGKSKGLHMGWLRGSETEAFFETVQ